MEQRLSLVTLGVADQVRAREFYEAVGWTSGAAPADDVVFFQAGCNVIVALWGRPARGGQLRRGHWRGWGGTLAYNARSPEEVDAVLAEAEHAEQRSRVAAPRPSGRHWAFSSIPTGTRKSPVNPHWTIADDELSGSAYRAQKPLEYRVSAGLSTTSG